MEENVSQTKQEAQTKPEETKALESKSEGETTPIIEAAKEANRVKAELLDREEKLQARKEKFQAEQMLGGTTQAGQGDATKEKESDIDYSNRVFSGEANPLEENEAEQKGL